MTEKYGLIIVDIQMDYFPGGKAELVEPEKATANAEKVLSAFRAKNLPVYVVQHVSDKGAPFLAEGTPGVEVHPKVKPTDKEFLVQKKTPSSFFQTNLASLMKENGVTHGVVVGMMSHMCVDSTSRDCVQNGFKLTVLEDCCTTMNLEWKGEKLTASQIHASFMAALSQMWGKVTTSDEFIKTL
ncbi:putative Cysteine hydrolase [Blattamonas nauphoetae]|uniref:Cysteine hydrolase n=1 Tax=Blattamonas nauphoetae TaxID=2049346 RepID=A0ABQ9X1Y6_9EUKA|nr:putative Cysteine hydrolase [Blattamonas nauphoetae]